uniref:Uncharacterized protein n=1 Tax=Trypanosoma congolense (strain IL3000) TaxID=1068625 RepID=G0URD0_TRYCI|nr:hypothetical protein, unlikely [Trypanosoma congolense IL3000]
MQYSNMTRAFNYIKQTHENLSGTGFIRVRALLPDAFAKAATGRSLGMCSPKAHNTQRATHTRAGLTAKNFLFFIFKKNKQKTHAHAHMHTHMYSYGKVEHQIKKRRIWRTT